MVSLELFRKYTWMTWIQQQIWKFSGSYLSQESNTSSAQILCKSNDCQLLTYSNLSYSGGKNDVPYRLTDST